MNSVFEIERKFIIKMPDTSLLEKLSKAKWQITQVYIGLNENGFNCRIRKIIQNSRATYFFTEKKNINGIKRIENEYEIDEQKYDELLKKQIKSSNIIEKTRYLIEKNGFVYEIDIYPFWQNQAVMEIELESEEINPEIPDFIQVIKDVTFEKGYSNYALSKKIPNEIK